MTPQQWGSINYWLTACILAEFREWRANPWSLATWMAGLGCTSPEFRSLHGSFCGAVYDAIDHAPAPDEPFAMWCADVGVPMDGYENLRRALLIADAFGEPRS